ncbi:HAD family hydrolase [uncultured Veillonella sp.]|uniref:HAD family hydrolase n=1 Tax=uncultured Veillonella sp. TaxID=159268 RepID=UPI0025FE82DC|nr:HAD family hydrolase [uncultured Veillonella sp.]MDY3973700.1 HAD family hydrolase [Veillonella caviae]
MDNKPVVALMYDFDKTLCTKDMQEYGFISDLGMEPSEFWNKANSLAAEQEMDGILAYMYTMVDTCRKREIRITKEKFNDLGKAIEFFPGVLTWFKRMNEYADSLGLQLEHYIVSSGVKEIIEGTPIKEEFKKIYACEFMYDYNDLVAWPKVAVNYTGKTQFLFRINKGVLDLTPNSDAELNRYTPSEERRIPFRNMVYIGDGITDVPCMKLVKVNGGQSIAVYNPEKGKDTVKNLVKDNRVNFISKADYSEHSEIDIIVKAILDKMAAVEAMRSLEKFVSK